VFTPRRGRGTAAGGDARWNFAYPSTPRSGTARSLPVSTASWSRSSRPDTAYGQIFTSKTPERRADPDWLKFRASPRARNQDRQWAFSNYAGSGGRPGKDQSPGHAHQACPCPDRRRESLLTLSRESALRRRPALYAAMLARAGSSAQSVVENWSGLGRGVTVTAGGATEATLPTQAPIPGRRGLGRPESSGAPDVWVRLSPGLHPGAGGLDHRFFTHGHGRVRARVDCLTWFTLTETQRERMVDVHWAPTEGSSSLVAIPFGRWTGPRRSPTDQGPFQTRHVNMALSAT